MHKVNSERHVNRATTRSSRVFTLHDRVSEFNLASWRTKLSSLTDIIALSGAKSLHCHLENVRIFGLMA